MIVTISSEKLDSHTTFLELPPPENVHLPSQGTGNQQDERQKRQVPGAREQQSATAPPAMPGITAAELCFLSVVTLCLETGVQNNFPSL